MTRPSLILALAAALAAAPAAADDEHQGKQEKHGHDDRTEEHVKVHFGESQHAAVQGWYEQQIKAGHCPPGLAKKHNGCLPPGQAKKRYVVGQPLPPVVVVERVPTVLVPRLRTAPPGYEYVWVDGDVLLMETRTRRISDAIAALLD